MKNEKEKISPIKILLILMSVVLLAVTAVTMVLISGLRHTPKIAVVDNNYLVTQFSEAIAAQKEYAQQKLQWDNNLKTIQDSLDTIVKVMSTSFNKSSPAERSSLESRLNHWNQEYRRYLKTVDQMSVKKEQELMAPVIERLNAFVKTWAKQNGFDIIIGSGNGGVILSTTEQYNVTDRILSDLNMMYQDRNSGKKTYPGRDTLSKNSPEDSVKKK